MSSGPFRVVLTGQLVTGFSREAVVAALARRFETSAGTLVRLFDQGGCPIDADLTAEEAAGLQEQLEQIGAMARIERTGTRPSHATRGLRLPHAGEAVDAGLMTCPACGHRQLVARQCDECGVVFAEFNRARRTGGPTPRRRSAPSPRPGRVPRSNPVIARPSRRRVRMRAMSAAGTTRGWTMAMSCRPSNTISTSSWATTPGISASSASV